MNKTSVLMKASFIQLRPYLWTLLGLMAIGVLANLIVSLAMGDNNENTQVSLANLLNVFLILAGSVLPVGLYKKAMNLGATRKDYYFAILLFYFLLSAIFALINVIWLQLEINLIRDYAKSFNILEIFGWDRFGIVGMFVYQFGAYLLLVSLLNLLFSGLRHAAGWAMWVFFIAAIPIFTSIPSLRHILGQGLLTLLFNDSLLKGLGLTLFMSAIFLAGGWWFTKRRTLV